MNGITDLKKIGLEEKKILQEAEKIEEAEKRINAEEKKILASEQKILQNSKDHPTKTLSIDEGLTSRELQLFKLFFVRRISKHKFIFSLIIVLATVLIWRGIWHSLDSIPVLSSSLISLGVGVLLFWLLRKYTKF